MEYKMEQLPYEFIDFQRKIQFTKFDLPSPWINYLSNGRMHAFISQAGGGMCWWLSPMVFRITRYRFYNLPTDTPGFYIYIRMKDGTIWSPTFTPCATPVDERSAFHEPGVSEFMAKKDGICASLKFFMAQDYDVLLWDLVLQNESGETIECDVYAYVELSQYLAQQENTLGYYLKWNTRAEFDEELQAITYAYTAWMHPRAKEAPLVYFGSSEKVQSYCCNRDVFCGNYRDERNPKEINERVLSNTNLYGGEPCAALHSHIKLVKGEEYRMNYYLGVTPGALDDFEKARLRTKEILNTLRENNTVDQQYQKVKDWWKEHLGIYQTKIPDEDAEREINTWNPLQSVHTGRYSRSISSSASGVRGIGFRDTAQDMLAQAYRKPEWARDMLYYLASLQLEDGHPVHTAWPEDVKLPQDITRSDNHIWMIYLAYAILSETGDFSILDHEITYLGADLVTPSGKGTLWEHLLKGIEFTENHLGEHGLPLILFSDWNDHLGPYGRKGKGESVMVAEQLIYALRELVEIAKIRGDEAAVEKFKARIKQQEKALKQYAWDGEWYIRGLDDDAKPIGSKTSKEMQIWLNPQSWMVIANVGTKEQHLKAMDSAAAYLGTELGFLLNNPDTQEHLEISNSMVNGLPAGYSENGGIFCQANCWAIMAEALLGRGDKAWNYYKQILPHTVIKKIGVERYHSEAYAYCSTMLGKANEKFGWGVVSQVTGTAAWMDVIATQYLLGVRPTLQGLLIRPAIPSDWEHYEVKRVYRGCELHIYVENPSHVQNGVIAMSLNGEDVDISAGAYITEEMLKNQTKVHITVTMGNAEEGGK